MSSQQDQPYRPPQPHVLESRPAEPHRDESSSGPDRWASARIVAGRRIRALLGLGLSLVIVLVLGTSSVLANTPSKPVALDSFDRPNAVGWGTPDRGKPWLHPTGRARTRIVGGEGVMVVNGRGRAEQSMLNVTARNATVQFDFSLDRLTGGTGVAVVALLRKSEKGSYHVRVRIGQGGRAFLSLARVDARGRTIGLGSPVAVPRYQPGTEMSVRARIVGQNPTRVSAMAWPAQRPAPARWQLFRQDGGRDIEPAGRVGLRVQMGRKVARPSAVVRFDDLRVVPVSAPAPAKTQGQTATKKAAPKAKPKPKATPPAPPSPANRVHVPSSIDATGSSNVSGALQNFVEGVPDNSTVVFPAGAVYHLGGWGIRVNDKRNITFEGNGTTLRTTGGCEQWNSAFGVGVASPSSDITIHGFKVRGHNPSPGDHALGCQHEHGVTVHGSTNVLVYDVDVRNVYGDCFYVGEHTWPDGVTFRDSTCSGTGRMGVAIVRGRNVTIERVTFDNIAIHVFDIEPNHADEGAVNVAFRDNTVGTFNQCHCFGGSFFAANGNLDALVRNVEVRGNLVTGGSLKTLVGDEYFGWSGGRQHRDIRFLDNRSTVWASGPVLVFKHVDGLTVTGNTQQLNSGELAKFVDTVNVTYHP